MRNNNKNQSVFSNKLSSLLTKLKDASTVQIGHEQIKSLLGEFSLKQIIYQFTSKMDSCDQLSERQKKQYAKIYMALIDAYKQEILFQQYFDRILDSLNKKNIGVGDVLGHLCKNLLNRIQPLDNAEPYIAHILGVFRHHNQIAKILKNIVDTMDPGLVATFQNEILNILHDKIGGSKTKAQYLETILALVLCLEERFTALSQIMPFLVKYLKFEDWNGRKVSVDICYALLVINHQISQTLHLLVKELKYDKIKHVRDAVCNYQVLYKQFYGQDVPQPKSQGQVYNRENLKTKSQYSNQKKVTKSPNPAPVTKRQALKEVREKSSSLDRSVKSKQKNENFFKNAKNSDVIVTNEESKAATEKRDQLQMSKIDINHSVYLSDNKADESSVMESKSNFEAYLKNRKSPKNNQQIYPSGYRSSMKQMERKHQDVKTEVKGSLKKVGSIQQQKFSYFSDLDFKKKNEQIIEMSAESKQIDQSRYRKSNYETDQQRSNQQFSISYIDNRRQFGILQQFRSIFKDFENRINQRLDRMERRIDKIEKQRISDTESLRVSRSSAANRHTPSSNNLEMSRMHYESPSSYFYSETPNESKWDYSQSEPIQSNLDGKVKISIANQNWDQAYTLALTNNKKAIILYLLDKCTLPRDPTVLECLLLEVRKLLDSQATLKWLKFYLLQKQLSKNQLEKFKQELQRKEMTNCKNYELMRRLVLNEIAERLC